MAEDTQEHFRKVISDIVGVLVGAVERQYGHGPALQQIRAVAATLPVQPGYATIIADLEEVVREEMYRQKREDPFNRLIVHPLSKGFKEGTLTRDCLNNYFSFIHMVLGEQQEILASRCSTVYSELRDNNPHNFTWNLYYEDPRAQQVLWAMLVRVADSFRRFDVRRQWFISLMQYTPQTVSVGSNAFVTRSQSDDKQPSTFGRAEFNAMFACLYGPFRTMSTEEHARFVRDFGVPPEKVFAALWQNLEASGVVF